MELKPVKFGVKTQGINGKVDRFGQVQSADEDSSKIDTESPDESARAHYRADTDSSKQAIHHSLGSSRNQAAPGNHIHDGISSPKLGTHIFDTTPGNEGQTIPALSITGSKSGNAALGSLITLLQNFIDFNDNTSA